MAAAGSNYRQVRLTITEEAGGWLSVRIMVKPLAEGWKFQHSVYQHRWRVSAPTPHWLDLLAHAYSTVGMEDVLPRE